MFSRFNFYDIYGYFIPGLTAVVLIALPLLLLGGVSFPFEFNTALLVAVCGYVAGLLIHEIGRERVPSRFACTADGKERFESEPRFPGDYFLGLAFVATPVLDPASQLAAVPAAAGLLALLSSKALQSYHRFAEEFARSVLRGFLSGSPKVEAVPRKVG